MQGDAAAGGMREDRPGLRQVLGQHPGDDRFQIELVIIEILDMAGPAIAEQALGSALSAPIEARHAKAAREQFIDHLPVFLDEFGAALQEKDRPLAACAVHRREEGCAQAIAVARFHALDPVGRKWRTLRRFAERAGQEKFCGHRGVWQHERERSSPALCRLCRPAASLSAWPVRVAPQSSRR